MIYELRGIQNNFNTLTAAQWLARVAASNETITLPERKVLYEFAKTDSLDSDKIIRLAYGLQDFE